MNSLQPTLKRGRDVWDRINMPEAEFQERVEKIRKTMDQEGLDLLLLYGHGADHYANPAYVSNFLIKMPRGALVVLPSGGEPVLIVDGFPRDQPAVEAITWMEEVRSCRDVAQECLKMMREKNLPASRIGLAGPDRLMPYLQFRALREALSSSELIDADPWIQEMRRNKSEREQDQIRRASRIIQRAFDWITRAPLPSLNEKILEACLDYVARLEGAEDVRILIGRPEEAEWTLRIAEDVPMGAGEKRIVSMAVAYERYWSETVRTLTVGASSFEDAVGEDGDALYRRIMGKMETDKPVSQFCSEAMDEIRQSSFEDLDQERYGLGHGLGLSSLEEPLIAGESTDRFGENECLSLRLALRDPQKGDVMIGHSILLSKSRVELLV